MSPQYYIFVGGTKPRMNNVDAGAMVTMRYNLHFTSIAICNTLDGKLCLIPWKNLYKVRSYLKPENS